ncbi:unnamed protein product [Brachionus calyciflorus]|uniref:Uncharacterized protein n=1 Tax=Brachionus calyciflorus TaxID=104777 RepID=A0A814H8P9_9BILA|nr:unnamed protein product [Brachionus calyciflorus]
MSDKNGLIKSISVRSSKELKPSPCFKHEIKLHDILDDGGKLIQQSESILVSPLMLVSKPDNSIRVTIDKNLNCILKIMLLCVVNDHLKNWNIFLQYSTYRYINSADVTTNYKPLDIVDGRKPKIKFDMVIENEFKLNDETNEMAETSQEGLVFTYWSKN